MSVPASELESEFEFEGESELESEYAGAALCIVPLLEGSGTKIKVLEALMYGRPVVASQHSTRGFEALLGKGLVGAADDSQIVQQCVEHLRDACAQPRVLDRGEDLDSPVEVARHQVGAPDEGREPVGRLERVDPAVLEEGAEDAPHGDALAETRHPGPQHADSGTPGDNPGST